MTDEERQLICAVLRQVGGYWYRHPDGSTRDCGKEAANEIERLATLVQSDAEPKHPLGPNGKPMTDWYYDNDGVCRPSLPAKFEIERLTERVNQLEKTVEALGRM